MATRLLEISWDSYQNNVCQGLSGLQFNQEFVDMTLAADGCLVKVHRNILALSSPYIKAMLKSVDYQHPLIFLNNVSYDILTYILEYIYTGKVHLPTDKLDSFVKVCKELKIEGLQDVSSCIIGFTGAQTADVDLDMDHSLPEKNIEPVQSTSDFAALITINGENNLEIEKRRFDYIENNENDAIQDDSDKNTDTCFDQAANDVVTFETPSSKCEKPNAGTVDTKTNEISNDVGFKLKDIELKPNYTISNRGALQLLLNRYMYSCHHKSHKGLKRRWRCVDYRRSHCPAIIDTEGENITARKGLHNHPFHDQKILKKCRNSIVFKSIYQAATEYEKDLRTEDVQIIN